MILMLNIHSTRANDIVVRDRLITNPCIPVTSYYDGFGNWCSRIVVPKGQLWLSTNAVVDTGEAEMVAFVDQQHAVQDLPEECRF